MPGAGRACSSTIGEDRVGTLFALPRRALCLGAVIAVTALGITTGTASAASPTTPPFGECPAIGSAPSCDILLVVNPDQTISVLGDATVGPYDGSDDTLVGILNNSSNPVQAITVSGPNSDLAGFDGDGICTYATGGTTGSGFTGDSYCSAQQLAGTDPEDYAGPDNTFTLDPNSQNDVEVDFTGKGLAAGGTTYFSLEGALTAAQITARKGGLNARYVALGDSVPYGHGLANPYPTAQIGLPATAVSQGPSDQAYPALMATALHLTQSIRSGDCTLTGDELAISGAAASDSVTDTGSGSNAQCPGWLGSQSVEGNELPAAQLAQDPATLVTIQAGADDIDFADCIAYDLTKIGFYHAQGHQCVRSNAVKTYFGQCLQRERTASGSWDVLDPSCVRNGAVPSQALGKGIPDELGNLRTALAEVIEQAAPDAKHIAVLNYYQAIPNPKDFQRASASPGPDELDLVCDGLAQNLAGSYNDAVILQAALNDAIAGAVSDATSAGVSNVQLINIADLETGHEMCTGNPAIFSGEPIAKSQFTHDIKTIAECSVPIFHPGDCGMAGPAAEADLSNHTWRTAHPNASGQQDIARAVESQLGNL
jgi:lysophospholipase L1-like esterase